MYRWFQKSSLRVKATLVVLVIVATTLSVSSVATLLQSIRTLHSATHRAARLSAMHLAHVCSWSLQTKNNTALHNYVRQATYHQDVLFAAVYDKDRKLITFSSKSENTWMLFLVQDEKYASEYILTTFPIRLMSMDENSSIISAIEDGTQTQAQLENLVGPRPLNEEAPQTPKNDVSGTIGYVTVGYSTRAMYDAQREQAMTLLVIFLFSSSVAGWIVYLTMRNWTRRLAHLAHVSQEIANGNFDEQIIETSQDEIGQLGRACEKMRLAVFERDQALRHFNDLLQDEVDERTCELVGAKESAEMSALHLQHSNEKLLVEATERQRSEHALRKSEKRYVLAARGANDGLWDWDLSTDQVYYSTRWREIVGNMSLNADGSPQQWYDLVHPDDIAQLKADLKQHWEGATEHFENEHRIVHVDGSYHWILARGVVERNDDGSPYRMAGSLRDITARKEAESRLRYQALHDDLTGLPNRTLMMDRLTGCVLRAKRQTDYRFAILFMDLDRFKVVNDSLGHAAGDELLVEFSRRVQSSLRRSDTMSRVNQDTIARLGGDEFVLLLDPVEDAAQVCRIADRLQKIMAKPFYISGQEVFTSGSIGIAIGDSRYDCAEDVLRDADMAMYRAKSSGRARYDLYDEEMHKDALVRLQVENDLRRALDNDQFVMQYQPIVDLNSGLVTGFEALIRWDHPLRGRVAPGVFIPIAE
ncbi:MAG: diguanylate cyclase, partial [Phycisphaeraceae bacterium]|nr:diguanylate cyclase [Phycisphaeraceae bacterium]